MRRRRRSLTMGQVSRMSARACRVLSRRPEFIRARRIGIFFPSDGEVDVTSLVNQFPRREFYLPVLPQRGRRRLWFARYHAGTRLIKDRFGIPEPLRGPRVRAENLDLVLVPLVAFDAQGKRIGMGGGFYDTSLKFLLGGNRIFPTSIVGVAYHFQQVESIDADHWDVPLRGVATDKSFVSAQ